MKEVFLNRVKYDITVTIIFFLYISIIGILIKKFVCIEYIKNGFGIGLFFSILPGLLLSILVIIFLSWLGACKDNIVNSYKLKEVNEYRITNEQYVDLKESISKDRINISEVVINNATNTFECLDIALDISNLLGINDYSSGDSSEKVIRVEVYKAYINKFYFLIDYPEKITILKEIR